MQEVFIPVWLTLTIGTVIISMWFAKYLMTYEKNRDAETPGPSAPAHSH
jgi:Na+/proline symporter